ncbi:MULTISPECIES: methyltransferase domain-containing protein [Anaeromyxobacter]|uniref:methyltransferase domain-containing protein n=1 Tax=Anaeromyxobacter TaxID=161492 RepID=UPI001F57F7BA|nr:MULTISPECIES: methyltransferase domain-containing protein [unclassified Anaeromyxobacter]
MRLNPVDKRRVRAAFSRSAASYDARAEVQRAVQDQVLALLAGAAPGARRVLDVGAGTGALLSRLLAARPGLAAAAVDLAPGMCGATRRAAPRAGVAAADAEALPFRDGAFDLVVTTSTLQWLPRVATALEEARRVLAPGGVLCVALFGERTLFELREAFRDASAGSPAPVHRFLALEELARALGAAGLTLEATRDEELVERHADARAVLRALKAVGATSAVPGRTGLSGRRATLETIRRYEERHGGPGGVPATYHVLYAIARRPAATSASPRAPSGARAAPSPA